MKLAAILGAVLAALALQYFTLIRPWYQTWGATADEASRQLPGDELVPDARTSETRAVTIRASPEQVWPWLAQLGQHRGGFYSYRFLENLVGCEMPAAERLLGLPDPRPGEKMWMAPPDHYRGVGYATYARVDPPRAISLRTAGLGPRGPDGAVPPGSWSFVLEPRPDGTTRLLVRGRAGNLAQAPGLAASVFSAVVYDPIHFVMERKMMLGLRDRAEGRRPVPAWVDTTYSVLWLVTGLLGISALVAALVRRREAWKPLAAGTLALVVLTMLFFARPPLAIAIALVAGLRWALSWAWRRSPRGRPPAAAQS